MSDPNNLEQLKLEVSARLEEYKALRSEILSTLSAAYLTTSLTLTAVGFLLAAAPFIVEHKFERVFLWASFLFYFIGLTQLRYEHVVFNMSQHIIRTVAPGVRDALAAMTQNSAGQAKDLAKVLSWEQSGRGLNHRKSGWETFVEVSRYILPLMPGFVCLIIYAVVKFKLKPSDWMQTSLVILGIVGSFILCCATVWMTWKTRKKLGQEGRIR
jgi:hypothetical protein